jgi:hypothetical protein
MGDKERSRENVGRREEGLKAKARQMELMVREAEARSYKMEQVLVRISWPVSKNTYSFNAQIIANRKLPSLNISKAVYDLNSPLC